MSPTTIKIFCGECGKDTNHNILCKRQISSHPEDPYPWWKNPYFCQCAGCDAYSYAVEFYGEDDWDPITGEPHTHWKTYPTSVGERTAIEGSRYFPAKIASIYLEVISAINSQLLILSAIGLRTLIEAICKNQGTVGNNLVQLIDGLAANGILAKRHADILHSHRFLGNVATHELKKAKPIELLAALEISENMLKTLYIIPEISKTIKTGKP